MSNTQRHFALIGASFAGNKGAEAMILASISCIRERWPGSIIHVLSYLPDEDLNSKHEPDVYIHSATPATLVLKWLPISLACVLIPSIKKRADKTNEQGIASLLKIDAVFDIFGVSFMDSRIKFLPFNIISLFPFIINRVPCFKLSQAMGPFKKAVNHIAAKWTLNKMAFTTARGNETQRMLQQLSTGSFPEKIIQAADIAFLLKPFPQIPLSVEYEKTLAIIPSIVVDKKLLNYQTDLIQIARSLHQLGWKIKIIVHSWRNDSNQRRHNDLCVATPIQQALQNEGIEAPLIGIGMNSIEIRDAIGKCDIVLTSRFHGMIAALTTARPVIVIGWSHKYAEVLEQFQLSENAIPYSVFTPAIALQAVLDCHARHQEISQKIAQRLPEVRASAEIQFNEVKRHLSYD